MTTIVESVASLLASLALLTIATAADAATVYTGDVIPGPMGRTARDTGTFYGDAFCTVRATHGGFLELPVDVRDAMIEPGTRVVQILHDRPDPKCGGDGCAATASEYIE